MEYNQGQRYAIRSLKVPIGCTEFPIECAEFVRSYKHYGIMSHVFRYSVNFDDYIDWLRGWVHIAANYIITEGKIAKDRPFIVESHVHDRVILAIE